MYYYVTAFFYSSIIDLHQSFYITLNPGVMVSGVVEDTVYPSLPQCSRQWEGDLQLGSNSYYPLMDVLTDVSLNLAGKK